MFSLNLLHSIETHGVIRRIRRSDNLNRRGLRTAFLPWIPIAIGVKRYRYWAQNYWLCELANLARLAGFTVRSHSFVWQTFENISEGKRARFIASLRSRGPSRTWPSASMF
jgi:hypothetical protein